MNESDRKIWHESCGFLFFPKHVPKKMKLNQMVKQNDDTHYAEAVSQSCYVAAPATLSKKRIWHRCFPVNSTKFLRTPFKRTPPVAASNYIVFLIFNFITFVETSFFSLLCQIFVFHLAKLYFCLLTGLWTPLPNMGKITKLDGT